jgi:hypothetical protein
MSLNFDDRRTQIKNDYNNYFKQTYNRSIKKNNQKKIFLGMSQDPYINSNSPSQNNKVISPTLKNVMNIKSKKPFQNKSQNAINDQFNFMQKLNKKSKEENNYKHNRSFEQNSINNDILLQYKIESPLVPGISDNCGNEIIEILNLNGNKNPNKIKKIKKKNLNNSYILQSKYKNIINESANNNPENINIKDNNNISSFKGNKNNIYRNNISTNINVNKSKDSFNDEIDNQELIFRTTNDLENYKIDEVDIDEYPLNSSFENNKSDFHLLYNDDYHKTVKNDMLSMEIQLLYEKILELQRSYHNEAKKIYDNYCNEKKSLKLIFEKKAHLKKKTIYLLNLKEKRNIKENNNAFIGDNIKKTIFNDSSKINKNEIFLLKKMFPIKEIFDEKKNKKYILKQIFKNAVFDRYKSISNKLNDIEKNIINNLMKKYKYNEKFEKPAYNNNKRGINNNIKNLSKSTNRNNKGKQNKSKKSVGMNYNKNSNVRNNFSFPIKNKIY